jgi:O-6-methylguanine DNA methyltransferase
MKTVYYYEFKYKHMSIRVASSDIGAVRVNIGFGKNGHSIEDMKAYRGEVEFQRDFKKNKFLVDILKAYLNGDNPGTDIPWDVHGTPFMLDVWENTCRIPYGETRTYGEIALMTGKPKAARAVGQALHRNQLLIIIPCHRVVSSKGIGGFGSGIDIKKHLLNIEGSPLSF